MESCFFQAEQAAFDSYLKKSEMNLSKLQNNRYPGRGIILGISEDCKHVAQVYWLMGRSPNSQNRILKSVENTGTVKTDFFDKKNAGDPSLVIYDAMLQKKTNLGEYRFVVSNGHQTNSILKGINFGKNWTYEPDEPNFTPRIVGITMIYDHKKLRSSLMIIAKHKNSMLKKVSEWNLSNIAGFGHCVHTYNGDGDPLPSFQDAPYILPLKGDIEDVANLYWDTLNPDYRVSLVVKFINIANPGDVKVLIKNKHNG